MFGHTRSIRQPDDSFTVFWEHRNPSPDPNSGLASTSGRDVFARRFSADAVPVSEPLRISNFEPSDQHEPRSAAGPTGEHVVVWRSDDELGAGRSDILARRFASDGRPLGSRFPVNPALRPQMSPDVAVDGDGDFVVVWFFDRSNVELVVKVLDGREITGHYWVFYGSLSNVAFTVTVTDTLTGASKSYVNPSGEFASVGDVRALPSE